MQTDLRPETATDDRRNETLPARCEGRAEADGSVGNLATPLREEAPDPALPTVVELRAELLSLQQRLDAIVGDDDRVHSRVAADSVASERIAVLSEQVSRFQRAVRERRRLVGRRMNWFRRLWSGRGGAPPRGGAVIGEKPEVRGDRAREAQMGRQLFDAGIHHLR